MMLKSGLCVGQTITSRTCCFSFCWRLTLDGCLGLLFCCGIHFWTNQTPPWWCYCMVDKYLPVKTIKSWANLQLFWQKRSPQTFKDSPRCFTVACRHSLLNRSPGLQWTNCLFCLGETLLMQYNFCLSCCCAQASHDLKPSSTTSS